MQRRLSVSSRHRAAHAWHVETDHAWGYTRTYGMDTGMVRCTVRTVCNSAINI